MMIAGERRLTMIEVIAVIVAVVLLVASIIPLYFSMVGRTQEAEIISTLRRVSAAQKMYKGEFARYPDDKSDLESAGFIDPEDYDDLKYLEYSEISIPSAGVSRWSGTIEGYDYNQVEMLPGGKVSRSE